jgi:hypothetical protein
MDGTICAYLMAHESKSYKKKSPDFIGNLGHGKWVVAGAGDCGTCSRFRK